MGELPELDRFYRAAAGEIGFLVVALHDTDAGVRRAMGALADSLPTFVAPAEVGQAYGVTAIPTTVVVDASGRIVSTHGGAVTAERLQELAAAAR